MGDQKGVGLALPADVVFDQWANVRGEAFRFFRVVEANIEPRPWFADTSWKRFLSIAPNPLALSLGEAINEA